MKRTLCTLTLIAVAALGLLLPRRTRAQGILLGASTNTVTTWTNLEPASIQFSQDAAGLWTVLAKNNLRVRATDGMTTNVLADVFFNQVVMDWPTATNAIPALMLVQGQLGAWMASNAAALGGH